MEKKDFRTIPLFEEWVKQRKSHKGTKRIDETEMKIDVVWWDQCIDEVIAELEKETDGNLTYDEIVKFAKSKYSILGVQTISDRSDDIILQHIRDLIFQFHGDSLTIATGDISTTDNGKLHTKGFVIGTLANEILKRVKERTDTPAVLVDNPEPVDYYDEEVFDDNTAYESSFKYVVSRNDYPVLLKEAVQKVRSSFYYDCLDGCLNKIETEAGSIKYEDVIKVVQKTDENRRMRDYLIEKALEVIKDNRIIEGKQDDHFLRMAVDRLRDDIVNEMTSRILQESRRRSKKHSKDSAKDCIADVKGQLLADKSTNKDNLRDKAEDAIRNYIHNNGCDIDIKSAVDKIVDDLEDRTFHSTSQNPTNVIAQQNREKVQESPENKFVKLR